MTSAPPQHPPAIAPLDEQVDHIRGPEGARVILEYGDYECPYAREAYWQIRRLQRQTGDLVRFAFRHFPLTHIHPRALPAAAAAEAAELQGRFWEMSDEMFRRRGALGDPDLRDYANALGLDLARFDADRSSAAALSRVKRDVKSGLASRQVQGTPTLFIDGVRHPGTYDAPALLQALERSRG